MTLYEAQKGGSYCVEGLSVEPAITRRLQIKEIHQKEVLTEDVFSDSVYLYSKKDDSFCRGAGNRGRDAGYM